MVAKLLVSVNFVVHFKDVATTSTTVVAVDARSYVNVNSLSCIDM